MTPPRLQQTELFAWIGEDEHGSGVIGLKQAEVPAGYIPLVATTAAKMSQGYIRVAMGVQAHNSGKRIYLCRFTFDSVVLETGAGEPPL